MNRNTNAKKRTSELAFFAVLAVVSAYLLIAAPSLVDSGTMIGGSKGFPPYRIIQIGAAVLLGSVLVCSAGPIRSLRQGYALTPQEGEEDGDDRSSLERLRYVVILMGLMAFAYLISHLIGLVYACVIMYVLICIYYREKVIYAMISTACVYAVIQYGMGTLLSIPFPSGILLD